MDDGRRAKEKGLTDRISSLPDGLKEIILGFLPIHDAVRTSVLARSWRYCWTKTPEIRFDGKELEVLENGDYQDMRALFFIVGERILSAHDGRINRFSLCVLYHDEEGGNIGLWLRTLSRKGIKDLCMRAPRHFVFDLPPEVYQCIELTRLSLKRCVVEILNDFKCFPSLVCLTLSAVDIPGRFLESLIYNCPLEELHLHHCRFGPPAEVAVSVTAPNLKIYDSLSNEFEKGYSYLKYTPNLKVATISYGFRELGFDEQGRSGCIDSLCSISVLGVEVLRFKCPAETALVIHGNIPQKLPVSLINLKTVTIDYVDVILLDHISTIFCIIRSSPNLRHLNINMECPSFFDKRYSKKALDSAISHLEEEGEVETQSGDMLTVKIWQVHGNRRMKAEIAFISNILSCCPNLGTMSIHARSDIKDSSHLHLNRAVKRFRRSSWRTNIEYQKAENDEVPYDKKHFRVRYS